MRADPRKTWWRDVCAVEVFFHMEFFAECGRLLLLSISASYVGANIRRLAVKHGWDHHLLYLVYFFGTARRWPAHEKRRIHDVHSHIGE